MDGPKCGKANRKGRLRAGLDANFLSRKPETSLFESALASRANEPSEFESGGLAPRRAPDSEARYCSTRKLPETPASNVNLKSGEWCNNKWDFEIGRSTVTNESRVRPLSLHAC